MSKIKTIIELKPPTVYIKEEMIKTDIAYECPECHGLGWIRRKNANEEYEKFPCHICKANGYLYPPIHISWTPKE